MVGYIIEGFDIDYLINENCSLYAIQNGNGMFLDQIGVDIFLCKKDEKLYVCICHGDRFYFEWKLLFADYTSWLDKLEEVPEEVDDEIKFLKNFLSFSESFTDMRILHSRRRSEFAKKYKLM